MARRKKLSQAAEELAPLLGVFITPVEVAALCDCAGRLGLHSSAGAPHTFEELTTLLEELVRAGLVVHEQGLRFGAAPAHADALLLRMSERMDLARVLDVLDYEVPFPTAFRNLRGPAYRPGKRELQRVRIHARLALHTGNELLIRWSEAALACERQSYTTAVTPPGLSVFLEGADIDTLRALPFQTLRHALAPALDRAAILGLPCDAVLAITLEAKLERWTPYLLASVAVLLLARGEAETALSLLDEAAIDEPDGFPAGMNSVRALVSWVLGHEEAERDFDAALAQRRRELGRRRVALSFLPGLFHPLVLIARGKAKDLRAAEALIEHPECAPQLQAAQRQLLSLVDPRHATQRRAARSVHELLGVPTDEACPWLLLFAGLSFRGSGEEMPSALTDAVEGSAKRVEAAGHRWLAAELSAMAGGGESSLLERIGVQELWDQALSALEELASGNARGPGAVAAPGSQRLVFVLDPEAHFAVEVFVQKLSKKGWTQGRKAALKTLSKKPPSYLTPADEVVLRHVVVDTLSGYGRWGETHYRFDGKVHEALVGHPRVAIVGERSAFVTVVAQKPVLEVLPVEGGVRLVVRPEGEVGVSVGFDEAGMIAVRTLTAAQASLAKTLAHNAVSFPDSAQARLGAVLAALAPIIPVQGEALGATVGATEVRADSKPRFRLRPEGKGVHVQVRVLPLGPDAPAQIPGEGAETLLGARHHLSVQARRDMAEELVRVAGAVARCPSLEPGVSLARGWFSSTLDESLELLGELRALGDEAVVEWPEGDPLRVATVRPQDLKVRMTAHKNWLEPRGDVRVEGKRVLALKALLSTLGGQSSRFVELDDGSFLALERSLAAALSRVASFAMKAEVGAGAEELRLHPLATLAMDTLEGALSVDGAEGPRIAGNAAFVARMEAAKQAQRAPAPLPRGLRAELRPYQLDGFRWLARLGELGVGACLADDMGLGKTVQALALLLHRGELGPALVSAPTSVCNGWAEEILRFAPDLRVHMLRGAERVHELGELGAFDVVLCSHGLLQREQKRLAKVRFATFVLDEAQVIKNASTARAKAVFGLDAAMRVATTGTPIENHLGELHSLFRFLEPGLLGTPRDFRFRYAEPIERAGDAIARRQLRDKITPFILRRTKSQVLQELPPRTDVLVRVEAGPEQRAFYEAVRERAIEHIEDGKGPDGDKRMQVLAALTRLRQACCHPALVAPDADVPSAKMEAFLELFDELRQGGHRALVFSQFVRHLDLVRKELDARDVPYQYLDGSTPAKKRAERVRAFQAGEGDVFLISLKAGGTGLNLTGADYVVHLDPWWNPAVEDQATDRAHRIGQTRPVTAYRLIVTGTVEDSIVELHHKKRDLAERLLSGTDQAARLSVEEMLDLVRGADAGLSSAP